MHWQVLFISVRSGLFCCNPLRGLAIVHIYLVFYHDYIEQRGETSSIIGGWKFIEEEIADKEEVTENAEVITKSARRNE